MDFISILETFGVPVAMSVAFGFFIWKQNKWIQDELQKELRESFERLENIIDKDFRNIVISLINAQKETQIKISEMNKSYRAIVEIMSMLSGNGLKSKFLRKKDKDDDW
jgi:aminoglycoside/choline kinase family phosphotransferase